MYKPYCKFSNTLENLASSHSKKPRQNMESNGSEPGLVSREPSFSSYCSNTLAETAARVSMEDSSVQYHLDYEFEFDSLPESDNNVFPVFNRAALLLNEQDNQVEAIKKDNVSPPSLDAKKREEVIEPVHYKKSNSVIGSSSRRWSFTRFLRRSNSLGAPTRTNNINNNTIEEEKEGDKLGCHGFKHYMCPCTPTLPANKSKPTRPEKVDKEKLVVMEKKISSKSSSSAGSDGSFFGSDGSDKSVFPVPDTEIVPLDKRQSDHVEVMKEHDDSTSSNLDKPEGVKYKKSKSTGSLSRRWSFKGLLRRSRSEREAPRSTNNIEEEEEGEENPGMFSRCFSLSSRSSSNKLNLEEGEKLGSDGFMLHLCPCLSSLPADSTQRPKEADQERVAVKENKPSSKCSTGSGHESKNKSSAYLGKLDGYSKRPKLQNNAHKVYMKKNSESWKASSTPYRQETISFFAMVRPLVMLFTASG